MEFEIWVYSVVLSSYCFEVGIIFMGFWFGGCRNDKRDEIKLYIYVLMVYFDGLLRFCCI